MANILAKQVGPLPLGMWGIVVAGGLGIGYVINRNMARSQSDSAQLTESGVGEGGGQFVYDPPESGDNDNSPKSNFEWGQRAKQFLIAKGMNPILVDNTIRKYLQGLPLTLEEQGLVNMALTEFGAPPEYLPPVDGNEEEPPPGSDVGYTHNPISGLTAQVIPKGSGVQREAPPAVGDFTVIQSSRRNDLVWSDKTDTKDMATHYNIRVVDTSTGKPTEAKVISLRGVNNTYRWTHTPWPGTTKNPYYRYIITPVSETLAGPPVSMIRNFQM